MGRQIESGGEIAVRPHTRDIRLPSIPWHPRRAQEEPVRTAQSPRLAAVRARLREETHAPAISGIPTQTERANAILQKLTREHEGKSNGFDYEHEPQDLLQAIHEAEAIADKFGFRMIVVGGAALTRHIDGQDVHLTTVNTNTREITIAGARNPGLVREEDGTITDIDTIIVRKDGINPFNDQTGRDYEALQEALALHVERRKNHHGPDGQPLRTPSISVEPVYYHPPFPQPNALKKVVNFNSRIDVYQDTLGNEHWFTTLGPIQTEFDAELLQTWRVKFADRPEDPGIPTLMIPAYRQRFFMRGVTIKEKDKKKTGTGSALWKLQEQFYEALDSEERQHSDTVMRPWLTFSDRIQHDWRLAPERLIWQAYWGTIGDSLAHEKGFIGEAVQPLRKVFTAEITPWEAVKQMGKIVAKHNRKRNRAHAV